MLFTQEKKIGVQSSPQKCDVFLFLNLKESYCHLSVFAKGNTASDISKFHYSVFCGKDVDFITVSKYVYRIVWFNTFVG